MNITPAFPIHYVNPVFRPPSEAQSLILPVTNGCSWNQRSYCEMYTEPQKKFGLPGFTDYPSEIHLLAGEYDVQIYCFKGLTSYRPHKTLALQAGKTYLLQCGVEDGQPFIHVNASAT